MRIAIASRNQGFTLIELMTVILIMGLAVGVGLQIDFGGSPQQLRNEARAFRNTLGLMQQESILGGAIIGLDFFVNPALEGNATKAAFGYRWLSMGDKGWVPAEVTGWDDWLPEVLTQAELVLAMDEYPVQLENKVALENQFVQKPVFAPEVWLLPTGEISPFTLQLQSVDGLVETLGVNLLGDIQSGIEN